MAHGDEHYGPELGCRYETPEGRRVTYQEYLRAQATVPESLTMRLFKNTGVMDAPTWRTDAVPHEEAPS